jgi:hypothetical protein
MLQQTNVIQQSQIGGSQLGAPTGPARGSRDEHNRAGAPAFDAQKKGGFDFVS